MDSLIVRRSFDPHVHGRDGDMLKTVGPMTARQFWGAIFEPNLDPPITTGEQGQAYLERIRAACGSQFKPYLLGYLTDSLDPVGLADALADGTFIGAKFYPRGATTNSHNGIEDVTTLYTPGTSQFACLEALASAKKVLQLHCELNFDLEGRELDPYRKEAYFFEKIMPRIIDVHPQLRISCEHLSCKEAAHFMRSNGSVQPGCSLTAHHLHIDRRDMFRGGLRPHLFCLPVVKAEEHRMALLELAIDPLPFVWAGTDSAPHDRRRKEAECCSGGIFTAHAAIELYAEAFDGMGALDGRFEKFMSVNGPVFYGLKPSNEEVRVERAEWTVQEPIRYSPDSDDIISPYGYHPDLKQRHVFQWKVAPLGMT